MLQLQYKVNLKLPPLSNNKLDKFRFLLKNELRPKMLTFKLNLNSLSDLDRSDLSIDLKLSYCLLFFHFIEQGREKRKEKLKLNSLIKSLTVSLSFFMCNVISYLGKNKGKKGVRWMIKLLFHHHTSHIVINKQKSIHSFFLQGKLIKMRRVQKRLNCLV